MYPCLKIDLSKIKHNTGYLVDLLKTHGMNVAAVTKVFCSDARIVETICERGIAYLADSRLENIEAYPKNGIPRMLLRLPSPKEAARVVKTCDISLNSEIFTLGELAKAAQNSGVTHGVILMVDLGDLREGVYHSNGELLDETCKFILSKKSLRFMGIGVNLTCYGAVLPTSDNLQKLIETAKKIEQKFGISLEVISGGNSSSLYLFDKGEMPKGVTNLRLGESIIRGLEAAYGKPYRELKTDAITLEAEIVELMEKPTYPEGEIGMNAFGEKIHYDDIGPRIRAILAVGRQEVNHENLVCIQPGVTIVGSSSDHLIVDVTDSYEKFTVGSILAFSLSYGGILSCFTSRYVGRRYE